MSSPLLSVRGVKAYYGNIAALRGVDIDVGEGEIVALIGANGAGKSTLMMTIFGNPRATRWQHILCRPRHHAPSHPRDRGAENRAGPGRSAYFPPHDRDGEPADRRGTGRSGAFRR